MRLSLLLLTLTFFLSFPAALLAQSDEGGWLRGRVVDVQEPSLPGVAITLSNLRMGLERIVIANATGDAFPAARNGRFRLTATATGFATAVESVTSE